MSGVQENGLYACEDFTQIFAGHRNFLPAYHPLVIFPLLDKHIVFKSVRLGLFLARFQYTIYYENGENNAMADIMKRGYRGYRESATSWCDISEKF